MGDSLVDSSLMLKADLEVDDDILLDDDEEDNNDLDEESESSSYEEVVPEKNEVGEAAKKPGVARFNKCECNENSSIHEFFVD